MQRRQLTAAKIIMYASCPADLQRQYLVYVLLHQISGMYVSVFLCTSVCGIHKFCSPDFILTSFSNAFFSLDKIRVLKYSSKFLFYKFFISVIFIEDKVGLLSKPISMSKTSRLIKVISWTGFILHKQGIYLTDNATSPLRIMFYDDMQVAWLKILLVLNPF